MYRLKYSVFSLALALSCVVCRGQFLDSASGLLQAPSAEMGESGTFMITTNYLNRHSTPPVWGYDTYAYGLSIVLLPRIEIGYVATLMYEKHHRVVNQKGEVQFVTLNNQDRHFYGKLQLLQEGEFGINWIPALAVGASDPTSAMRGGKDLDYLDFDIADSGNGYFNRYYVVATKHFSTPAGIIGTHLGYQYNLRRDLPYNGPCAALDWEPVWLQKKDVVSAKFIAEYDARTVNVGLIASIWRDHFDLMVDLQALKWLSAGVRFKMVIQ